MRHGFFSLLVAVILMIVMPIAFANMLSAALLKLNLQPQTASIIVFGIFAGSLINIPVRRIVRSEPVMVDPLAVFGLHGVWPEMRRVRQETVIAVNVGGCVVPTALAIYEAWSLLSRGQAGGALALAVVVNVLVCYLLARPVKGVGITMPALVPAAVAAGTALLAAPAQATPVAFVAGVFGPLVGADLLNLPIVERVESGMVSIGGAGTFDGILLSAIVALYLA